eukprot:gene2511-4882_t
MSDLVISYIDRGDEDRYSKRKVEKLIRLNEKLNTKSENQKKIIAEFVVRNEKIRDCLSKETEKYTELSVAYHELYVRYVELLSKEEKLMRNGLRPGDETVMMDLISTAKGHADSLRTSTLPTLTLPKLLSRRPSELYLSLSDVSGRTSMSESLDVSGSGGGGLGGGGGGKVISSSSSCRGGGSGSGRRRAVSTDSSICLSDREEFSVSGAATLLSATSSDSGGDVVVVVSGNGNGNGIDSSGLDKHLSEPPLSSSSSMDRDRDRVNVNEEMKYRERLGMLHDHDHDHDDDNYELDHHEHDYPLDTIPETDDDNDGSGGGEEETEDEHEDEGDGDIQLFEHFIVVGAPAQSATDLVASAVVARMRQMNAGVASTPSRGGLMSSLSSMAGKLSIMSGMRGVPVPVPVPVSVPVLLTDHPQHPQLHHSSSSSMHVTPVGTPPPLPLATSTSSTVTSTTNTTATATAITPKVTTRSKFSFMSTPTPIPGVESTSSTSNDATPPTTPIPPPPDNHNHSVPVNNNMESSNSPIPHVTGSATPAATATPPHNIHHHHPPMTTTTTTAHIPTTIDIEGKQTFDPEFLFRFPPCAASPPQQIRDFCMPNRVPLRIIPNNTTAGDDIKMEILYGGAQSRRSHRSFVFMVEDHSLHQLEDQSAHYLEMGVDSGRYFGICVMQPRLVKVTASVPPPGSGYMNTHSTNPGPVPGRESGVAGVDGGSGLAGTGMGTGTAGGSGSVGIHMDVDVESMVIYDILAMERLNFVAESLGTLSRKASDNDIVNSSNNNSNIDPEHPHDVVTAQLPGKIATLAKESAGYKFMNIPLLTQVLEALCELRPPKFGDTLSFYVLPPAIGPASVTRDRPTGNEIEHYMRAADWALPPMLTWLPLDCVVWTLCLLL